MQTAVSQQTKTTGIRGDVSTDTTRSLGTEVEREEMTSFGEISIGVFKDDTGVKRQYARVWIEIPN